MTLTVQHPEEAVSGTEDEDESQDVSEYEDVEGEEYTPEVEEPELETADDRERYYQEVRGPH